jgi:hypothetical protein
MQIDKEKRELSEKLKTLLFSWKKFMKIVGENKAFGEDKGLKG